MIDKWDLNIERVRNGYILTYWDIDNEGDPFQQTFVIEIPDIEDEAEAQVRAGLELLYFVRDRFEFRGSKHDSVRIIIDKEAQPQDDEDNQ
jgi:hypothetical protein